MSVTQGSYEPAVWEATPYGFIIPFESIGPIAVEVWEVLNDTSRILVAPQDYVLIFEGEAPLFDRGLGYFTRPYHEDIDFISIERNTPITQVVDFQNVSNFHSRMVEFALDKAMMILQEIAYRKCDDGGGTPQSTAMTQLMSFPSYSVLRKAEVDWGLWNLTKIAREIKAAKTDCILLPEQA